MEKNKKALKIGMIAMAITLTLSFAFLFYLKLDNPVFFENYCDYGIPYYENSEGEFHQQDFMFTLQYVTNATDQRVVSNITFPEAPMLNSYGSNSPNWSYNGFFPNGNESLGTTYGSYQVRTIYVTIMDNGEKPQDNLMLSKATVHYNNGDTQDIDLGMINLYCRTNQENYLEGMSNSSSSDGSSSSSFKSKKDITLMKVDSPLLKYIDKQIDLKVNDVNYSEIPGLELNSGNFIDVKASFEMPKHVSQIYNTYRVIPILYYQDHEGKVYIQRIFNIDYIPLYTNPYSFIGLIKFLKDKGEL